MHQSFVEQGVTYTPFQIDVPLDYADIQGTKVSVFARLLAPTTETFGDKPLLVYLQGGPGFPSPRPIGHSGWLKRALQTHHVVLLDQRGTGQSSVISHQTLRHLTPEQQAEYLSHFRADNIIRDAEELRKALNVEKWSSLGQSFGGFCTFTYLSMFPDSLHHCYVTGGVPPVGKHPDEIYQQTFQRTLEKNHAFFAQFPKAQEYCHQIAQYLINNEVLLPNGQRFTVEQFQQIGINFGMSDAFLPTYYQLENAFVEIGGQKELRFEFLNSMLAEQSFHTNPIYALLHESIYCEGFASQWSADRIRKEKAVFEYSADQPFLFTGEMVFPWMFDQYTTLSSLKQAANLIAEKADWGILYDQEQLKQNKVPLACAVYADDMFVDCQISREVLSNTNSSDAWVTNEFEHNGLRADGERILDVLMAKAAQIEANAKL